MVEAGGDMSHAFLGGLMSFLCQVARSRGDRGRQSGAGRSCHPGALRLRSTPHGDAAHRRRQDGSLARVLRGDDSAGRHLYDEHLDQLREEGEIP